MSNDHDITLIRNTFEDEDGNSVVTYGVRYTVNDRVYTVRHMSTKRYEVEAFIACLIDTDDSLSAIDDLLEDFVS